MGPNQLNQKAMGPKPHFQGHGAKNDNFKAMGPDQLNQEAMGPYHGINVQDQQFSRATKPTATQLQKGQVANNNWGQ